MTIDELSRRYNVDIEKLKLFEKTKLITVSDELSDTDLRQLGIVCTLYDSGFTVDAIKRFLGFGHNKEREEQIKLLNLYRHNLLDEIHKKQKNLDNLDYIIYEIKNKA